MLAAIAPIVRISSFIYISLQDDLARADGDPLMLQAPGALRVHPMCRNVEPLRSLVRARSTRRCSGRWCVTRAQRDAARVPLRAHHSPAVPQLLRARHRSGRGLHVISPAALRPRVTFTSRHHACIRHPCLRILPNMRRTPPNMPLRKQSGGVKIKARLGKMPDPPAWALARASDCVQEQAWHASRWSLASVSYSE